MMRGPGDALVREAISGGVTHPATSSGWPSLMMAAHLATNFLETADKLKG